MIRVRSGYVRPVASAGWERIDDTARPDIARIWSVIFPWSGPPPAGGDFVKLGEAVAGSNTSSLTISGLSVPKPARLFLAGSIYGVAAGEWTVSILLNGQASPTDWNYNEWYQSGLSINTLAAQNNSTIGWVRTGSQYLSFWGSVVLTHVGQVTVNVFNAAWGGFPTMIHGVVSDVKFTAIESITRVDIVSSIANNIATGSWFAIYRML